MSSQKCFSCPEPVTQVTTTLTHQELFLCEMCAKWFNCYASIMEDQGLVPGDCEFVTLANVNPGDKVFDPMTETFKSVVNVWHDDLDNGWYVLFDYGADSIFDTTCHLGGTIVARDAATKQDPNLRRSTRARYAPQRY